MAGLTGGAFVAGEELIFGINVCNVGPREGCDMTQGLTNCTGCNTCGDGCTMISDIGTCTGCGICGGEIGSCDSKIPLRDVSVPYFSGLPTNNFDNVTHVNVVNDGQPTVYVSFDDCRIPFGYCEDICYEDFRVQLDFINNESITLCPADVSCDDGNPCTNDQ
eukprot:gene28889-32080_t